MSLILFNPTESATIMFAQPVYSVSEGSIEAEIEVQLSGMLDSSFTVNVLGPTGTVIWVKTIVLAGGRFYCWQIHTRCDDNCNI